MARAELRENPRANQAIQAFAAISLSDAEKGCHELFKKLGYCPPVKIEYLEQDGLKDIPYVKLSSWVQWLLDTDRAHRLLVGVDSWEKWRRDWRSSGSGTKNCIHNMNSLTWTLT